MSEIKRNYGIDMLKICSMIMILILHILSKTNLLTNVSPFSLNYCFVWILEITCFCSVNCYAMISGYNMWNKNNNISKAINLWFQVMFYSLTILFIALIFFNDKIQTIDIINSIFPITRNQYWYITSYIGMYIFIPAMNIIIDKLNKRRLETMFIFIFIIIILFPNLLRGDPYNLNSGYSVAWLSIMYLLGAYFSKYKILQKIKIKTYILTFIIMILLTFTSKICIYFLTKQFLGAPKSENIFISYLSPTIIINSICMLSIFSRLKIRKLNLELIKKLSVSTLGVYLIHVNPILLKIINYTFPYYNTKCHLMLLFIFISTITIYSICSMFDIIRIYIFKKVHINTLCIKIEEILTEKFKHFITNKN